MFEDVSFTHAIATAMLSYGGFPAAPLWYKRFTNTIFGKLVALTILIYQAGGRLNILFSLLVAIIFYFVTEATKRIHIYIRSNNDKYREITDNIYNNIIDPTTTTYEERVMSNNE
jgi:hypothetical protein